MRRSITKSVASAWTNRTPLRTGDWVCIRCSFVNIVSATQCSECLERRHAASPRINEWTCYYCGLWGHIDNKRCTNCLAKGAGVGSTVQLPESVRLVKRWTCAYCSTDNKFSMATCRRCKRLRK